MILTRFFKILSGLALCLALCACSGGKAPRIPDLSSHSGNFETSANISYRDLKASAAITRESPRSCSVVFTSPESLKDMSFIFWQDKVELSYKRMSFTFDPGAMPGAAAAGIAVSAINSAMKDDGLSVQYADSALTLNGVMESGEFSLRLDSKSGNLLKLSVPGEDLEIEFVNFTFLD